MLIVFWQIMKPKNTPSQRELFGGELAEILNHKHPLVILASKIDWSQFEKEIDPCYAENVGRPGLSYNQILCSIKKEKGGVPY
jgi:hypothetical protein